MLLSKQGEQMEKIRMLHLRFPEEMHRKIRFICADEDISIQAYVRKLIEKDLEEREMKEGGISEKP